MEEICETFPQDRRLSEDGRDSGSDTVRSPGDSEEQEHTVLSESGSAQRERVPESVPEDSGS